MNKNSISLALTFSSLALISTGCAKEKAPELYDEITVTNQNIVTLVPYIKSDGQPALRITSGFVYAFDNEDRKKDAICLLNKAGTDIDACISIEVLYKENMQTLINDYNTARTYSSKPPGTYVYTHKNPAP